jgi:hypothetical protein
MAKLPPWLQLLSMVARQASGLRDVELRWGADTEIFRYRKLGAIERGLGDSLDFVRALGKIQGLENLVIKGYYAKNWQAYLSKKMIIQVRAICGGCREEYHLTEGDIDKEALENLNLYVS